MMRASPFLVTAFLMAAGASIGCAPDEVKKNTPPPPLDTEEFLTVPKSCAYICPNATCAENDTPYACPAMGEWPAIAHETACPAWDGKYPTPKTGQCKATEPSGEALKQPGPDAQNPGTSILPNGRAITPAGKEWVFELTDVVGGMTSGITAVPGTPYVLTVDIGNQDHAVRAIDTSKIGQSNRAIESGDVDRSVHLQQMAEQRLDVRASHTRLCGNGVWHGAGVVVRSCNGDADQG
jgi:hypothetical protein